MKFKVVITETLIKEVFVEANNSEKAEEIVKDRWYDSEYALNSDDFESVFFEAQEV